MSRSVFFTFLSIIFISSKLFAQNENFAKEWQIIEQLEIDGKTSSALQQTDNLLSKVTKKNNQPQQLKALLFRWKFLQIIDEKSQEKILEEVSSQIQKQASPNKELLEMYMAHFLETHLNTNFYNLKNRTHTENANLKDYRTWDLNTTIEQINTHYENALKPTESLTKTSTDNISSLLITSTNSREYKPTVYDIIAHKALGFYTNTRNRIHKPKDEFLINDDSF